jgi:trimeric autotransporter adhesin
MNFLRSVVIGGLVILGAACDKETEGTLLDPQPTAGLRYVNAARDTSALNFRIVDIIGNTPGMFISAFRDAQPYYQPVDAGTRHIKVFLHSTNAATAQTVIYDTTFTFDAGNNYTFMLTGNTRTGQTPAKGVVILQDTPPSPAGIAVRVFNAGAGLGAIDAYLTAPGATISGAPTWANIPYRSSSQYVSVATGSYAVQITAAGSTTVLGSFTLPAGEMRQPERRRAGSPVPRSLGR